MTERETMNDVLPPGSQEVLSRLCRKGLVEQITNSGVGGIFEFYRITEAGRAALQSEERSA